VLEITDRAVLCVNLVDEVRRHGLVVDARSLARDLGIPVVLTAARQGEGIPELLQQMHDVATGAFVCRPHRISGGSRALNSAVNTLAGKIAAIVPGLPNARWVAFRLLEGDPRIIEALRTGDLAALAGSGTTPAPAAEMVS
jgi:ferrous iron transport protein B